MSVLAFHTLAPWAMALSLASNFAAGAAAGLLHVGTLWWNTRRFAQGGRATTTAALMVVRFAVLGGMLLLASLEGAPPLLAMALGILAARMLAVHKFRMAVP